MLEYGRIDVPEGIDVNKTNGLRCCIFFFHYWSFLEINFRFQTNIYDDCFS